MPLSRHLKFSQVGACGMSSERVQQSLSTGEGRRHSKDTDVSDFLSEQTFPIIHRNTTFVIDYF
jgi:hypothetical protein